MPRKEAREERGGESWDDVAVSVEGIYAAALSIVAVVVVVAVVIDDVF